MDSDEAAIPAAARKPDRRLVFPLDRRNYDVIPPLPIEVVHHGWLRTTVEYVSLEELQRRRAEEAARPGFIQRLIAKLSPARN